MAILRTVKKDFDGSVLIAYITKTPGVLLGVFVMVRNKGLEPLTSSM